MNAKTDSPDDNTNGPASGPDTHAGAEDAAEFTETVEAVDKTVEAADHDIDTDTDTDAAEADLLDPDPDSDSEPADEADRLPAVAPESTGSNMLVLGQNDSLEISGLAPEQVSALRMQYAQGMIDVQKKATELKVDVDALDHTLRSLTSQTESATRSGVSITATHSQSTSLGRTEVILGNTEQAARGKLSRLQSGAEDNPILYVAVLAGAIIFGALLIALLTG